MWLFEFMDDLVERFAAGWRVVDVVETEIGEDDVEGGVGKRHPLCRWTDEGADGGDAFD
jgi:hypothetical protein